MAKVFLSYATEDKALACEIFAWLTGDGHDVFFDRDQRRGIELGEDWKQRLYHELRRVDAVVSLVTPAYLASTWCTAEVAIADSRGCRILPLRTTDDAHLLLDRQQYSDLAEDPAHAREWLLTTLRRIDTGGFHEWRDGGNPYPGLQSFTLERSWLFFGRGDETRALAAQVRADDGRDVIPVTGPSGCGKSSLLQAGLVPALTDWLCLAPWKPEEDPLSALAYVIVKAAKNNGLQWEFGRVHGRLQDDNGLKHLANELLADGDGHWNGLLVAIDQGEQLFTRTGPDNRARLARLLQAAAGGTVRTVITLRSEFLDDLSDLRALDANKIGSFQLGPLHKDMLRLAIEEPAVIAGLRPEPELVARLVADTESGDALPLLAFALQQLAEGRSRGDRISLCDYQRLAANSGYGTLTGLHAVLASRADKALTAAVERSGLDRADVLTKLLRMVTLDAPDRRSQRRIAVDQLTDEAAAAFDAFVENRLLTNDHDHIGFAHEALLTAWPPLDDLIKKQSSALRTARVVERAAADWIAAGRADSHLWDDERLADLTSKTLDLDQDGQKFLDASRTRADTARRRKRYRRAGITTTMAALSVAALIAAGIAVRQADTLEVERDDATVRSLVTQADAARESDPQLSLRLALAAHQISSGNAAVASLFSTVTMDGYAGTAHGHISAVRAVAFRGDGRLMASGDTTDHSVRLWDVSDVAKPKPLGTPLNDHTSWVTATAFSPDGKTLATVGYAEVILWDVSDPATPTKRHTLEAKPATDRAIRTPETLGVAFAQEGRVLIATNGSALTFWAIDPAGPRRLSTPVRHNGSFSDVAISPNGQVAATATSADAANTVVLWDIRDPANPVELGRPAPPPGRAATSLAFGKDGAILAVAADAPGDVRLWDVNDPRRPAPLGEPLGEHANVVNDVAFAPDGPTMITTSDDGTAIMWDVSTPATPRRIGRPLANHRGAVEDVAFSQDGSVFATAGADGKIVLWRSHDTALPVAFNAQFGRHYQGVQTTAFRPGGHLMVTAAGGGPAQVWNIDDPAHPQRTRNADEGPNPIIVGYRPDVLAVAFSPDGKLLAIGGDVPQLGTVFLWNVAEPEHITRHPATLTGHTGRIAELEFSADSRTLRSAGSNLDVIQWDVSDPRQPREIGRVLIDPDHDRTKIGFSPDGRTLVTDSAPDGRLVLLDISNPRKVRDLGRLGDDRPAAFAFAPDGRVLATTGDRVVLWNLADPAAPREFGGAVDVGDSTDAVAFGPQGRILAIGSRGGSVSLWNVEDPDRPRLIGSPLWGHHAFVRTLAFSHDGRMVASGDNAGEVILWDLARLTDARENVLALACERAGLQLTPDEWNRYVGSARPRRAAC